MDRDFAARVRSLIRTHVNDVLSDYRVAGRWSGNENVAKTAEKSPHDLVSEIDTRIGTELSGALTRLLPGSSAWTEDGEGIADDSSTGTDRWIVDPIDGTANLVMGNAHYCTSVALEHEGALVAGFVYHPPTEHTYWTIDTGESYLDEVVLHPSERAEVGTGYVVFGFSANMENIRRYHREWTPAFENARKAIGLLAPALNICTVAQGSVDAFIDFGCSMEGQSAAGLILRNAGGTVAEYDGGPWEHRRVGIYASNGRLKPADLVNPAAGLQHR